MDGNGAFANGFAHKLAMLRLWYAKSMVVNSCCRSDEYNRKIDGHPRSLHVWDKPWHRTLEGTCAIDIRGLNPKLVELAIKHGWSVGIYSKFIHLDCRGFTRSPTKLYSGDLPDA